MRRVLIATEGSACSIEAVRAFSAFFEGREAELHVLSVIPRPPFGLTLPHEIEEGNREADRALEALDLAVAELKRAGFAARPLLRVGEPALTIVQVARDLEVGLIVLGTHRRQGIERVVDGSVAEEVLRLAPCAVMIQPPVPAPRDAAIA